MEAAQTAHTHAPTLLVATCVAATQGTTLMLTTTHAEV